MPLITLKNIYLSFSDAPLLDHLQLSIEPQERICLVGRNGAGKSTLMKIIGKEIPADDGQVIYENGVVVARLEQDPPQNVEGTVFDYVASGLADLAQIISDYHHVSQLIMTDPSEKNLTRLSVLQEALEHKNGWQIQAQIESILKELALDPDAQLTSLSGGWLRKVALAKALVCQPDVLLLDEPTNHLDISAIHWLETFLKNWSGSLIFISHDRAFINAISTRIIDLDRGKLSSWPGNYAQYLVAKEEALRVEEMQNHEFDKKLAQEEVWIRQGIKARRTRNEGRVRALKKLREEYANRRQQIGTAKVAISEALQSGKLVFEFDDVSYQIEDKLLVSHFSTQILRGDKIALIGPNGIGKTTLIKLMLGTITPTEGEVHCGTKLNVAYFDQYRAALDPEKTVIDNLADGRQEVEVNGRMRHALSYLQDFLFAPARSRTPVRALSGGERNRLLLAKLFLNPSNLLILDEPTNDLDVDTLELLEEHVSDYQGTVILVSHDRQFVDNVANQCWFLEGQGKISAFPGGYFDAMQQKEQSESQSAAHSRPLSKKQTPSTNAVVDAPKKVSATENKSSSTTKKVKLSYKEQRELEALPLQLETLEAEITALQAEIADPQFFTKAHSETEPKLTRLAEKEQQLNDAFTRWEELEEKSLHR